MKTQRNILIAFILNLSFAIFELFGGIFTGSVAILSDAIHDVGDAASIGASYFLEKKSRKQPDERYTYGYARYSVLGGFITSLILLLGSTLMIYHAVYRIIKPNVIHYTGMILFAVIGVCVNLCAAFFTRKGDSFNQKAVNLHMLEDVLGWVVVLIGAILMRFTNFVLLDRILSIGVSVFILIHAIRNLKEVMEVFLEKAPQDLDPMFLKEQITEMDGVMDVHHIHLWTLDGIHDLATMHVISDGESAVIRQDIRALLRKNGIKHVTIEVEESTENCQDIACHFDGGVHIAHNHHHHQ